MHSEKQLKKINFPLFYISALIKFLANGIKQLKCAGKNGRFLNEIKKERMHKTIVLSIPFLLEKCNSFLRATLKNEKYVSPVPTVIVPHKTI